MTTDSALERLALATKPCRDCEGSGTIREYDQVLELIADLKATDDVRGSLVPCPTCHGSGLVPLVPGLTRSADKVTIWDIEELPSGAGGSGSASDQVSADRAEVVMLGHCYENNLVVLQWPSTHPERWCIGNKDLYTFEDAFSGSTLAEVLAKALKVKP